jgi:fatty acid synthase subunit alpha, fungi type
MPFSRLVGKLPIIVAGMTPSTAKAGFVSTVLTTRFHVELTGEDTIPLALSLWKFQKFSPRSPLDSAPCSARHISTFVSSGSSSRSGKRCARRDYLLRVAAGIPSTEKAAEIIDALKASGIKHVAFKPGSIDGLRQVVNIAKANPNFPIILQRTGNKDFHQPIV